MTHIFASLAGIAAILGGFFGFQTLNDSETVGANPFVFTSAQLATSPQSDYILSTDGTNNVWVVNSGSGGGGGDSTLWLWNQSTNVISSDGVSTTATTSVSTASIDTTSTTDTSTFAGPTQFNATSTWASNIHPIMHGIYALDSSGLHLHSNNGTEVAYFGAGGGANITFPNYTSALLQTGSGGALQEYSGTTCTNQFVRVLSALGIATCASVAYTDLDANLQASTTNWNTAYTNTHNAVTLAGEDYLSLSTQQITANAINPDNLAAADFGDFTCNGTSCSLDVAAGGGSISTSTALSTGQVTFATAASTIGGDNNFFWDNSAKRLGLGTTTPAELLHLATPTGGFTTSRWDSGSTKGYMYAYDGDDSFNLGTLSDSDFIFKQNNITRGYIDDANGNWFIQNGEGDDTIFTISAPVANNEEATLTGLLDYGSGNEEFYDLTIEDFAGLDHLVSLNSAARGTKSPLPIAFRFWDADLGTIAAVGTTSMILDPSGSINFVTATSSRKTDGSTLLYGANTTVTDLLLLEGTGNDGEFVVQADGKVGIGNQAPSEILHISKPTGQFTTIRFDSGTTQGYFFAYDGDNSVNIGANSNSTVNIRVNNSTVASFTGALSDGCLNITSGVIGSTGSACGSGGGGGTGAGTATTTDINGLPGTSETITYTTNDFYIGGSASNTAAFNFDPESSKFTIASTTANAASVALEGATILDSVSGTLTLGNVDAIDATTETTFEAAIDALVNLVTVGTITAGTWAADLAADTVDAIGEIAAAIRTGADAFLVTGTAGTSGNLVMWNADGDAVDSTIATTSVALATGDTYSGTHDFSGATVTGIPVEKSFTLASTTLDTQLNSFDTGTTTFYIWNPDGAKTLSTIYCKTDTGTLLMRVGDGTNWTETVTCTSSGAEDASLSNGSFTDRENVVVQIGSGASTPNRVTGTLTF